jgi:hypothetical protein
MPTQNVKFNLTSTAPLANRFQDTTAKKEEKVELNQTAAKVQTWVKPTLYALAALATVGAAYRFGLFSHATPPAPNNSPTPSPTPLNTSPVPSPTPTPSPVNTPSVPSKNSMPNIDPVPFQNHSTTILWTPVEPQVSSPKPIETPPQEPINQKEKREPLPVKGTPVSIDPSILNFPNNPYITMTKQVPPKQEHLHFHRMG